MEKGEELRICKEYRSKVQRKTECRSKKARKDRYGREIKFQNYQKYIWSRCCIDKIMENLRRSI